ncbi:MAG: four helix bundle protein [Deltaproteobacteria bacterium]|nr:four helix bundle protein [Deltaproteobacteria bacterium]
MTKIQKAWQKSYRLCLGIYKETAKFPKEERFGLTSQMRRSAVSVPSNISEGYGRKATADYARFLYIAYGSNCELETYRHCYVEIWVILKVLHWMKSRRRFKLLKEC